MTYVCEELQQIYSSDGDGFVGGDMQNVVTCKKWVEQKSFIQDLAITKSDMVQISASLSAVFVVILAFVILAKAVKSM
ncbi:hypothetical protein [Faucicola boevrei]|uniref:hypothetical protein n=1 Tax=Faucicola boevrei TaxID=346665 RepID=UPI00037E93E8|nr:hypothetical protein [Moraxella boevrei]